MVREELYEDMIYHETNLENKCDCTKRYAGSRTIADDLDNMNLQSY